MPRRFILRSIGLCSALILTAGASLAAAAGPGLHGRVLGLDDEGRYVGMVAGATLEFEGEGGGSAAQATTGANGYYRVDLPAGVYTYKITADGYRTEDEGRGLEIQQSDGYVVLDFSMIRGESEADDEPAASEPTPIGLLDGRVFEINERGQRIGGIPQARIKLRTDEATGLRRVLARGGDPQGKDSGRYAVELPAGRWRASVSAAGFDTRVFPDPIPVTEGATTTRDFELRRSAPVTPTRQGIRGLVLLPGQSTRPRTRIRIESLLRPLATIPSLTPDQAGQFLRDLPAGSYRVVAEADGFHPAIRVPVTVFDGRYTTVVLRLAPLGKPEQPAEPEALKLAVSVQERTSKGLVAVAGARVLLRRDGDAVSQAARSDTDAQGATSFDVASEGNFAVLAQAKGFKAGGLKLHIGPGEPNRADVILLRATPDVEDQLVTVNGSVAYRDPQNPKQLHAVPRTRLVWRDGPQAEPVQIADSDAQGAFSVQLPAGKYVVELQPPAGFRSDKVEVAVTAKMWPRTFFLEPQAGPGDKPPVEPPRDVQVAGLVVGSPLLRAGKYVSIPDAALTWKGPQAEKSTRTDRAGRFSQALPPGLYDVRVQANGYDELVQSVVVQPGMENVRLALTRNAEPGPGPGQGEPLALNVRVMQRRAAAAPLRGPQGLPAGGGPLENADVEILQQGRQVAVGRSDRAGRYTVQLKPGAYDIKVTSAGFLPGLAEVALTTQPESREIVLTRASKPDDQRPPPQEKHTLMLRIVEQSAPRTTPETPAPDQTPPAEDSSSPTQKPKDGKRGSKGPARGGLRLQPGGASPLEQLQQRSQRDLQKQGAAGDRLRPAVSPIGGATIVIRQGENVVAEGTADKNGVYRVQLGAGTYDAGVSAPGFAAATQSIRIGEDDVTRQVVLSRAKAPR